MRKLSTSVYVCMLCRLCCLFVKEKLFVIAIYTCSNVNKSLCAQIRPSFNALQWVDVCSIYLVVSRHFKCNCDNCKSGCCDVHGRFGNMLQRLVNAKLYDHPAICQEACHINATDQSYKPLQNPVNNAFTKMLDTQSNDIIFDCQQLFDCVIYDRLARRKTDYFSNIITSQTQTSFVMQYSTC